MDQSVTSSTKQCRCCREVKPAEQFTRDCKRPDGLDPYCRACARVKRAARRDAQLAWQAAYRAKFPEVIKRRKAAHYAANRDRLRSEQDKNQFGVASRDTFVQQHGSVCAICGTGTPGGRFNRWAIDHDQHCCPGRKSCGRCVRGILCHRCNPGIGLLDEDSDSLLRAATYVLKRRDVLGELLSRI